MKGNYFLVIFDGFVKHIVYSIIEYYEIAVGRGRNFSLLLNALGLYKVLY